MPTVETGRVDRETRNAGGIVANVKNKQLLFVTLDLNHTKDAVTKVRLYLNGTIL
jgi:hypothetical protein